MYSAPRVALGQLGALKSLKIVHSPELRSLETCIVDLPSLESLYLRGCENLSSLPRARAGGPQEYSSLRELTIRRCPGVKSLPSALQQRLDNGLMDKTDLDFRLCQGTHQSFFPGTTARWWWRCATRLSHGAPEIQDQRDNFSCSSVSI